MSEDILKIIIDNNNILNLPPSIFCVSTQYYHYINKYTNYIETNVNDGIHITKWESYLKYAKNKYMIKYALTKRQLNYLNKIDILEHLYLKKDEFDVILEYSRKHDINIEKVICMPIKMNDVSLINYMIDSGINNYNLIMKYASYSGNIDLVKHMIEKNADCWDQSFLASIKVGCYDIFKLLFNKIKKYSITMYNALDISCQQGHLNMVKYIIKNNQLMPCETALIQAFNNNQQHIIDYILKTQIITIEDDGLIEAIVKSNKTELIKEDILITDASWLMLIASRYGRIDFINKLLIHGATRFNACMKEAAINGHLDILKLMISLGATKIGLALENASKKCNIHIINYILDNYSDISIENLNKSMHYCCLNGNIDMIQKLIQRGANDFDITMDIACRKGHIEIAKLMIKKGVSNWNNYMLNSIISGRWDLFNLIISHGGDTSILTYYPFDPEHNVNIIINSLTPHNNIKQNKYHN